jgi:hypothetical protein
MVKKEIGDITLRVEQWNSNRPKCANINCENLCHWVKKTVDGFKRWRAFCHRCHAASYGSATLADGVIPIKRGKCSNKTGRFGWKCPKAKAIRPIATEIDHIDGDYSNNDTSNLQELCKHCHHRKSSEFGDYTKRDKQLDKTDPFGIYQKHVDSGFLALDK